MRESEFCHHNLEWPPAGARLAGPVAWLRGWVVGKPGHDGVDLRVRHAGGTHLGVLGLPRADLAAHFQAKHPWLPAEFILGVPVADGPVSLTLEVMDAHGTWRELETVAMTIAPDGTPPPRVEGRLEATPDGTWTVRDAHRPFHGHLDLPGAAPQLTQGRAPIFGWLLDDTGPIAAVLATVDTLVFNHLEHSLTDEALARKVPEHAGARHARLRGAIDYPATMLPPACLRVYAVSPDGTAHLCFAQRFRPAAAPAATTITRCDYTALPERTLDPLPSGRPRRLLFVVRTLWPDDASLRALDLARHLVGTHRWAIRLVTTEDGPLRDDFAQADVGSLVVNPAPFFAAGAAEDAERALADLARQIRWDHLDAVAVFDPACGWALTLAQRRGIPTLFDCLADGPMQSDPTASQAVQDLQRVGWRAATALCFGAAVVAQAQHPLVGGLPATVIPQWHSQPLPAPAATDAPVALAPLRTVVWLQRHHADVAARWRFQQGPAIAAGADRRAAQDEARDAPALVHGANWSVAGVSLCLGPLFGRGPLRPVLDAAAAGIPVVAPRRPVTQEYFTATPLRLVDEDNPMALAHALIAAGTPAGFPRRAREVIADHVRAHHGPDRLLARWETLLASVAATRG